MLVIMSWQRYNILLEKANKLAFSLVIRQKKSYSSEKELFVRKRVIRQKKSYSSEKVWEIVDYSLEKVWTSTDIR